MYTEDIKNQINNTFIRKNGSITSLSRERYFKVWEDNIELINDIKKVTQFLGNSDNNISFRIKCILNDIHEPRCDYCDKPIPLHKYFKKEKYANTCSKKCTHLLYNIKIKKTSTLNKKRQVSYDRVLSVVGKKNLITNFENYKDRNSLIKIKCCQCDRVFESTAVKTYNNNGLCNNCLGKLPTKPIQEITKYLDEHNIKYELEYRDKNCVNPKTGYVLPFDICLYEKNIYIEYDGIFHYKDIYDDGGLEGTKYRDDIKTNYCKNNSIELIRLNYTDNNHISTLNRVLNTEDKYEIYDYDMYEEDIIKLINYVEKFKYNKVIFYSIYRGSIMITHRLTNELNAVNNYGIIQFQSYDGNDKNASFLVKPEVSNDTGIFVIDDIYDTGNTLKKVKKLMNKTYKTHDIHYITIYSKQITDEVMYLRKNKKFVKFIPWEGK